MSDANAAVPAEPAREFDVCISCASENSRYVDRVAALLKEKGVRAYYYKAKRARGWGKSLERDLDDIYRTRSKFCVVFLSRHYASKSWPELELKAALVRAFEETREYLLPVRFDDTRLPGLPDDVAYIDARETTPEQLVDLIIEKIAALPAGTTPVAKVPPGPKCWNCASPLNAGAKYCTECHQPQDWRRYLYAIADLSQRVKLLLVFLGAIVAGAGWLLQKTCPSYTEAAFVSADHSAIYLTVSNNRLRPARIRRGVLEFPEPKKLENAGITPRKMEDAGIPARAEGKIIALDVPGLGRGRDSAGVEYTDKQIRDWLPDVKATVWIEVEESNGKLRSIPMEVGGNSLVMLLNKLPPQEPL